MFIRVTKAPLNLTTLADRPRRPPMRRRPGETGVIPRNANLPPTRAQQFRSSLIGSSESKEVKRRPQRRRRKPNWMRSNDWVV